MLYNKNNLNVAKCADNSDTRPEISSVFFTSEKTVATDKYILAEISTDSKVKPEDYPMLSDKTTAMRGCQPFMIPAVMVKALECKNKNKHLPILDYTAISHIDKDQVEFIKTDLETSSKLNLRRVAGKFPDYESLFPASLPMAEVILDAERLIQLVSVLKGVDVKLRVQFYGKEKPVVLTCNSVSQSARGLIMGIKE